MYEDEITDDDVKEAIQYLLDVFPPDELFDRLVREGAGADPERERHVIDGDDLAGACHSLDLLARKFQVLSTGEYWRQERELRE